MHSWFNNTLGLWPLCIIYQEHIILRVLFLILIDSSHHSVSQHWVNAPSSFYFSLKQISLGSYIMHQGMLGKTLKVIHTMMGRFGAHWGILGETLRVAHAIF